MGYYNIFDEEYQLFSLLENNQNTGTTALEHYFIHSLDGAKSEKSQNKNCLFKKIWYTHAHLSAETLTSVNPCCTLTQCGD